jgi:hypothetical protein
VGHAFALSDGVEAHLASEGRSGQWVVCSRFDPRLKRFASNLGISSYALPAES